MERCSGYVHCHFPWPSLQNIRRLEDTPLLGATVGCEMGGVRSWSEGEVVETPGSLFGGACSTCN